jgi:ATP-binding cassette subfamily F protein uup
MVGDRLGIVGPNGVGKTTLLRILLEEMSPTAGVVRRGAAVKPVFFDQLRRTLDPEGTVIENLGEGYDTIMINNRRRHISAYMQDFLFAPEDANKRVFTLSGGEQNRLLLAKLFAQPSNLLVLDEPTNDLDGETLELLEDQLLEYSGTIIVVSHDRDFLDNVVTDCVVLTGDGRVQEFAGGYSDWRNAITPQPEPEIPRRKSPPRPERRSRQRSGLSYRQQEELDSLPENIASLEEEASSIEAELSNPALYKGATADTRPGELSARLNTLQEEIAALYQRWEVLEELRGS